jgi:hypothetical protein
VCVRLRISVRVTRGITRLRAAKQRRALRRRGAQRRRAAARVFERAKIKIAREGLASGVRSMVTLRRGHTICGAARRLPWPLLRGLHLFAPTPRQKGLCLRGQASGG